MPLSNGSLTAAFLSLPFLGEQDLSPVLDCNSLIVLTLEKLSSTAAHVVAHLWIVSQRSDDLG